MAPLNASLRKVANLDPMGTEIRHLSMAALKENRRIEQSSERIAPADLRDPSLIALWRYWLDKCPEGGLPLRSEIDPIRFPRLMPRMFIVNVVGEPPVFSYALVGEENIEAHGSSFKGQDLRNLDGPWPGYGASLHEFYSYVAARRRPVAARGEMSFLDKGFRRFEAIYLPLADEEGRVCRILGAAHYSS